MQWLYVRLLKSRNVKWRIWALSRLNPSSSPRVIDALITALYDENNSIAITAAEYLGAVGGTKAENALGTIFESGKSTSLRMRALSGINIINPHWTNSEKLRRRAKYLLDRENDEIRKIRHEHAEILSRPPLYLGMDNPGDFIEKMEARVKTIQDALDLYELTGSSEESASAGIPVSGAGKSDESRGATAIDLRGDNERRMETRARTALDGSDESIAATCVDLMLEFERLYNAEKTEEADSVRTKLREIGQTLWDGGGHDRMVQIAYRGAAIGGQRGIRTRDFEYHWDGIGDWMY